MNLFSALLLASSINLLPNGEFEQEKNGTVLHWEKPDGLTAFWVTEPGRGRVLKLDSRPDRNQVMKHWENRKKDPSSPAPKPVFAKAPYYSAIGGLEGVPFDSELIDVKPGQNYKLTVDVRGNSRPFVWIKGFQMHPRRKTLTDSYQTRLHAEPLSASEWRTFSIGFNPTARMPRTTKMKVRIYLYWPVGICYFDRIRIEEITPEEMKKLVQKRAEVQK